MLKEGVRGHNLTSLSLASSPLLEMAPSPLVLVVGSKWQMENGAPTSISLKFCLETLSLVLVVCSKRRKRKLYVIFSSTFPPYFSVIQAKALEDFGRLLAHFSTLR